MVDPLPESMQAVFVDQPGGPLTARTCPVPRPGAGQVLVRMYAAPINPSDLGSIAGRYLRQKPFPLTPGLEGSGTVAAAGAGLMPRWLLGRRVACTAQPGSPGTWAEYMVTSSKLCVPLAGRVTLEQGAMFFVNPLTALAFFRLAKRRHHRAIVNTTAAGALGKMILRLGKLHRIPVINIVRRKEQVDLLRGLGAEYVLDSSHPDFTAQLRSLAESLKATLLLDAVTGSMTNRLLEAAPPGSTLILYSHFSDEDCVIDPLQMVFQNKRIDGFYLGEWVSHQNPLQVLQLAWTVQRMLGTQLSTKVQRYFPLHAAQEAVQFYQAHMTDGKVLISAQAGG